MKSKERLMTPQEKEKFLSRVKIEQENFVGSNEPEVIFENSLSKYQEDMEAQVDNLHKLIKVQTKLRADVEKLYEKEQSNSTGLDLETLKAEIATKDKVINGARASAAVMEERIKLGKTLIPELVNKYSFVCDLDFYFNGALNLSETPNRVQQIVENNVKE